MIAAIGCLELLRVFWRFGELRALDVVQPTMVATVVPNLDQCCSKEGLGVRFGNVAVVCSFQNYRLVPLHNVACSVDPHGTSDVVRLSSPTPLYNARWFPCFCPLGNQGIWLGDGIRHGWNWNAKLTLRIYFDGADH